MATPIMNLKKVDLWMGGYHIYIYIEREIDIHTQSTPPNIVVVFGATYHAVPVYAHCLTHYAPGRPPAAGRAAQHFCKCAGSCRSDARRCSYWCLGGNRPAVNSFIPLSSHHFRCFIVIVTKNDLGFLESQY